MQPSSPFWVADLQTGHTQSIAFASTPEGALVALVELWIEKRCATSDAVPSYPWMIKEDIRIGRAELGKGYMLANHDRHWYPENIGGDDPRLAGTWDELAARYGVDPDAGPPGP